MAKDAVLGTNLVDSLVSVIDGVRGALHPGLGVRQFRVYIVTRTSGEFGPDQFVDSEIEIDPQPLVESYAEQVGESLRNSLEPCGVDEYGIVVLKEISIGYTEAELAGPPSDPNQSMFIRLSDAHGQGIPDRYFTPLGPPFLDRTKGMGWEMKIARIADPEGV